MLFNPTIGYDIPVNGNGTTVGDKDTGPSLDALPASASSAIRDIEPRVQRAGRTLNVLTIDIEVANNRIVGARAWLELGLAPLLATPPNKRRRRAPADRPGCFPCRPPTRPDWPRSRPDRPRAEARSADHRWLDSHQ